MRFKTTVIPQTRAGIRNACRTRLLDLEYRLPTQVRDAALALQNEAPTGDVNRESYTQSMESKVHLTSQFKESVTDHTLSALQLEANGSGLESVRGSSPAKDMSKQPARTDPYYKLNQPHICSFLVKVERNRGTKCPFR